jgi:glucose-6-phosphate 1-dehydrogenase
MINNAKKAPVIVIFGITGDLSKRKLLPALYHLLACGMLTKDTRIIGTSRRVLTKEEVVSMIELSVLASDQTCEAVVLRLMAKLVSTIQIDPANQHDFLQLKNLLNKLDDDGRRTRLLYMSIPASAYSPIVKNLAAQGLNDDRCRILLEKPFGYDKTSAEQSIKLVHEAFAEKQIYRIDHYLAKETAQNLLAFRLHNPIFRPLWNCQHIQSVRVRQFETIGIAGRVSFYEQTGALRDMVQSHLLQLLAITMMEVPNDMTSQAIHQAKQTFLSGLSSANPDEAIRAQYDSYKAEVGNPDSGVETYVRLKLHHTADSWRDTEIIIEHGKAMNQYIAEIVIEFKSLHERRRNSLTFQIQPNEGISLGLVVKEPGFNNIMRHTALDFRYQNTFTDQPYVAAYERVLMDAIDGDQSLFASDEEVITTWRILEPLIDAWANTTNDLRIYSAGSSNEDFR